MDLNPAVVPVYTECLRLCGNWLAETCLENPGVILENYLERVRGSLSGILPTRLLYLPFSGGRFFPLFRAAD